MISIQRKWFAKIGDGLLVFPWLAAIYAHIFGDTATSYVHLREWYWVLEMLFVVIGLGMVLDYLFLWSQRFRLGIWIWRWIMFGLCAWILFSFAGMLNHRYSYSPFPDDENMIQTQFIEDNTQPGALVGMPGGGTTAYFLHGRTMVNIDGLINNVEYFEMMRSGKGAQFLDRLGLDYVCCSELALRSTRPL